MLLTQGYPYNFYLLNKNPYSIHISRPSLQIVSWDFLFKKNMLKNKSDWVLVKNVNNFLYYGGRVDFEMTF